MVFTPRSVTVNESVPSSVVSLRVEGALVNTADNTPILPPVASQNFAAPVSYPATLDLNSGSFYGGVTPGSVLKYRVVEIGHDGAEAPSPWSANTVATMYGADGAESFTVNP